jgi:hypothetical protein
MVSTTTSVSLVHLLLLLLVDQPAGTGFSYASTDRYPHDLNEVCSVSPCSPPLLFNTSLGLSTIHGIPA